MERDGVLVLSVDQEQRLTAYHAKLLLGLAHQFDIGTTAGQKQMSWGMRIVSFLGALALGASVFFFFYRIWGLITTPVKVVILICAPLLALILMELTRGRERNPYFTSLVGLVAFAAFVLNLHLLGSMFNITPSQNAFLVWAAFGFLSGYTYELRLLLVADILSLLIFLSAKWPGVTNLGSTFFVIDLYTKFYDWWWTWMPKYLFLDGREVRFIEDQAVV